MACRRSDPLSTTRRNHRNDMGVLRQTILDVICDFLVLTPPGLGNFDHVSASKAFMGLGRAGSAFGRITSLLHHSVSFREGWEVYSCERARYGCFWNRAYTTRGFLDVSSYQVLFLLVVMASLIPVRGGGKRGQSVLGGKQHKDISGLGNTKNSFELSTLSESLTSSAHLDLMTSITVHAIVEMPKPTYLQSTHPSCTR